MRHIPYHPLALSFTICLWGAKDHARNELSGCLDEEDLHLLLHRMADSYDWTDEQQADLYARIAEAVQELAPASFTGMQSVITDALIANQDIYG